MYSDEFDDEERVYLNDFAMLVLARGASNREFRFIARVLYSNAIFTAYFKVHNSGMIEIEDDIPVAANLSGGVDMPVS